LREFDGVTNFTIAYVVQSALGGHAVPIDSGVLGALRIVELVTDKDVKEGVVPGMERAIAKAKGIEFGSMLHQLGADFTANPYSPEVRKILLEIDPEVEDRLPKRRARKKAAKGQPEVSPAAEAKPADPERKKASPPAKKRPTKGKKTASKKKAAAETPSPPETEDKKSATEGLSKRKPR